MTNRINPPFARRTQVNCCCRRNLGCPFTQTARLSDLLVRGDGAALRTPHQSLRHVPSARLKSRGHSLQPGAHSAHDRLASSAPWWRTAGQQGSRASTARVGSPRIGLSHPEHVAGQRMCRQPSCGDERRPRPDQDLGVDARGRAAGATPDRCLTCHSWPVSNRAHRRKPAPLVAAGSPPGRWTRVRMFLVWFFAPRVFPKAWQRRPYLRNQNRRPGKFGR